MIAITFALLAMACSLTGTFFPAMKAMNQPSKHFSNSAMTSLSSESS
jgi:hypothetical protein